MLGACVPRASTVLVSGLSGGLQLTVDATQVYFVDGAGVHAVPKTGGAAKNIADATGKPLRVAVDDTYAYWSENLGGAIMRAPKDGSGSPTLVAAATQPQGVAVADGQVFWVSNEATDYNLYRAAASGGTASVAGPFGPAHALVTGGLQEIVTDGSSVYFASDGAAFSLPIEADGGLGASTSIQAGAREVPAFIAARSGQYCGAWAGALADIAGIVCSGEPPIQFMGPLQLVAPTMPACGLAYGNAGSWLIAQRDLGTGFAMSLATDQPVSMATDGPNIYLLNTAGEIRVLPLP